MLFSRKKNLLQQIATNSWRTDADKEALLEQVKAQDLKPLEAIPLIWHSDALVRKLGVDLFMAKPNAEAVRALVLSMGDKPNHQRAFVQRIYARIPADAMQPIVDELIAHKDAGSRRLGWDVALALGGELRVKYLERTLREAPSNFKTVALQRLLYERKPQDMLDLLLEVADGADERLAATAYEALAQLTDSRVIQLMIKGFAGQDAAVREISSKFLREAARREPLVMRQRMLTLLGGGEDATRRLSVEILLATGEPLEVLLEILKFSRELVGWLRQRILETLQVFGDQVLRPAVTLLKHEDEEIRTAALVLSEQFNDPRIIGPVSALLDDKDWWLRVTACETLGRLKDERAVPALMKALEDDDARWAAIDALANIGSASALKPLSGLLRSPRQEVRMEVIRAFSRFSEPKLLPLLKAVMEKDPSSEVRTRAAEVLRDMSLRLHVDSGDTEAGTAAARSETLKKPVDRLLAMVREQGASDLHITVDEPPFIRVNGEMVRMDMKPLNAQQTEQIVLSLLNERNMRRLMDGGEADLCYAVPEVGRYRCNVFRQRLGLCAAFRVIPNLPPTFADIRLPGRLAELLDYHQGIIVVSGPAGSGKSTTLAAIVNLINESKPDHVITMEDPIEFVHPIKTALVNQREVGAHTESFARALRGALRQDPDVIVVGEMRDPETARMALTAAETGHLVVATMHTTSAVQTVERLVKSFPPDEQPQVRMALSEALKYVVSQSLVPRRDGKGRVAVFEILKGVGSIGTLIRDNKTFQIPSMMQIGQNQGMQTVDMALMDLYEANLISAETAWMRAEKPALFEPMCDPAFLAGGGAMSALGGAAKADEPKEGAA
jgi:twitching motility protein PilT